MDMKENRDNVQSGINYLLSNENMIYIIDCFVESPPGYSETIENLSRRSGVEENNVVDCLSELDKLDVIEFDTETYSINDESQILMELHKLNNAINISRAETN